MKKILLFASALAGLFLAASCQQENLEPVGGNTVTYTVQVPGAISTKVIGEKPADIARVNELVYAVYRTEATSATDYTKTETKLFQKTATVTNGVATVEFELVNNQNFRVLFWAHVNTQEAPSVYTTTDLKNVTLNQSLTANVENYAAFAGSDFIVSGQNINGRTVKLVRPIAQLNIATSPGSLDIEGQTTVKMTTTGVTVKGLSTSYNVAEALAGEVATTPFTYAPALVSGLSEQKLSVNGTDYDYVGMNYVGFAEPSGNNVEVSYTINTENVGTITNTIKNVPVKANYRTNIIGNLITSMSDYTITLDAEWKDPDGGNMEVVLDGLVKNINGDYEVATAKGLAYAINNLWAEGGNFYLTAAEYDMTGLNVTPAVIADGKTLNIYGETPVVTRAMTSIAGITIKGLDSIIETISASANVSISGVQLVDEGSVLVETNKGTLVVSESTGEENVVRNGNTPVKADDVKDVDTLNAALASAVKTINITDSFGAEDVVLVDRSVVINGNDKTFTTSANRAFRLTTTGIEVIFNDLKIVSDAVRVGTNDVRGVSVDNVENITLTLNDCSHDFTDPSANDWAYAVNVTGGTNHKVTINGGVYEGANVINVNGSSQTVTVKNATLNCTYPDNDQYYGACIWVKEKQESSVYAEGNTFNGSNAIAFNLGTGTALEEKDNVDNTQMIVAKIGETYFTSLAEAFDAVETEATIKVLHNTDMSAVTVKNGKTITLDLNGKTVSNITTGTTNPQDAILVKGNLTVKNGTITTEHKGENLGWSAMSTIFDITAGGVVNLNGVTAKNLGGTDMGFVAHLNNWGEVTFTAENCTLESNYVAVRVFNSGYDKNNVTIKNSTLKGGNYAFWVHNYTIADFGTLEKAIAQQKLLNFNLTEGNTFVGKNDTPIRLGMTGSMYLAADQIGDLPTYASVDSEETLIAALKNASSVNSIIYFANDITISNKWDNRYTGAKTSKPIEINGNGKILKFTGEISDGYNFHAAFRFENSAVVKNLTVDMSEATAPGRWLRAISSHGELTVVNCAFVGSGKYSKANAVVFGDKSGSAQHDYTATITDCTFTNWSRGISDNENANEVRSVTVKNNTCTYAHVYLSAYESVTFTGNTMNNSCVNIKSYSAPDSVIITVEDNDLDENQDNKF